MKEKVIKCLNHYNKINTNSIRGIITRTLLASILAADGLLNNNLPSLIPSMIISPIGSLLLDISINAVAINKLGINNFFRIGVGNFKFYEILLLYLLVLIITILIGIIYGHIHSRFIKNLKLPSEEMEKRSQNKGIIPSIIIAVLCAIALPIAYSRKDISTLISIGIATSLLPPIANIGLTIGTYKTQPTAYKKDKPISDAVKYGSIIFLINSICIFIGASLYFNKSCFTNDYKKYINKEPDFI